MFARKTLKKKRKIFFGSSSELRRVASNHASHVLLLAESNSGAQSDLTTIKALTMLVAAREGHTNSAQLVAEIVGKDNVGIAQVAAKNLYPIVSSSDFISKTMAPVSYTHLTLPTICSV